MPLRCRFRCCCCRFALAYDYAYAADISPFEYRWHTSAARYADAGALRGGALMLRCFMLPQRRDDIHYASFRAC